MTSKDLTISLLSLAHNPENVTRIYTEKIQHRPLFLKPNPTTTSSTTTTTTNAQLLRRETRLSKSKSTNQSHKKPKPRPLSSRQKRKLQLYALPTSSSTPPLNYETYLPLHFLWLKYIQELLNLSPVKRHVGPSEAAKLCSADFHGARLEVVRSRCVGRVGIKGVVVKDSMGVFEMVCQGRLGAGGGGKEEHSAGERKQKEIANERRDRKVLVPKEGTIFRFRVPIPTAALERTVTAKSQTSGNDTPRSERSTSSQAKDADSDTAMTSTINPQPTSNPEPNNTDKATEEAKSRELIFELHGDQFIYRAADRANRKFKPHFLKNL